MSGEGEPHQAGLFTNGFPSELIPIAEYPFEEDGSAEQPSEPDEAVAAEPEPPSATYREIRAVRSLMYNRLLLEVVQRRIEKAEAIVRSYLLTQDDGTVRIGPYEVEIDEIVQISASKVEEDDGWYQLNIPEMDEDLALEEMEEARARPTAPPE
jgi:hypothetical protein